MHRSIYSPKDPWRSQSWCWSSPSTTQNFQEKGKMLLSAAILLLGSSSALADGHVNNMGCCEQKNVPGHFYVLPCKMIVSLWINDFMNVPNPIQGQCPSLGCTSWIPNTAKLFRTSASMHPPFSIKLSNKTLCSGTAACT